MTVANASPRLVSRFEANLLIILHFLLRRDASGQALPLIFDTMDSPPCLSREEVGLIQNTLARGCISNLARASGWWKERHLKDGRVSEGRLWERHAANELALSFSQHTLRFLIWITAENPADKKTRWPDLPHEQLAMGDRLFLYLAFGALQETEARNPSSTKQVFNHHGLCRLAYPEAFAETPATELPDFSHWTVGFGGVVLEALQAELIRHWLRMERGKAQISDWKRMQELGQSQERVLTGFLDALEAAGRLDLARFLFPTLTALLPENPRAEWWTGGLSSARPRLADRAETQRAALVLPRQLSRLKGWERQARLVGYFDENYTACQLYKSDWERWQGQTLSSRAQQLLAQIEPFQGGQPDPRALPESP